MFLPKSLIVDCLEGRQVLCRKLAFFRRRKDSPRIFLDHLWKILAAIVRGTLDEDVLYRDKVPAKFSLLYINNESHLARYSKEKEGITLDF